ncbi:MAG: hypothetical protein J5965_15780 [Aeriscardovia sp.]|nr:hypothetical protein [Aeriscardovia sp.]
MAKTNSNNQSVATKFNVTFGVRGYDAIPANAAVLLNERKMRIDGELKSVTEFMAVEGVKSTKTTDLVLPVLAIMLADARTRGGFASDFKVAVVGSQKVETKLTAKSAFTKWLKGNVIYKSNSQGELNKALVLDEGLYLRNTALRVSDKQPIYTATGDTLRVLLFKTAEAITKQATMFKDIVGQAKSIFNAAYTAEEKKSEEKAAA